MILLISPNPFQSGPTIKSLSFRLDNTPISVRIRTKNDHSPTSIEVYQGERLVRSVTDSLYADSHLPAYIKTQGNVALLAYRAFPGAGSGVYASIWKISDRGRQIRQIGTFRYADLRTWFVNGIVSETRPTKYSTSDMLRIYPRIFEEEKYQNRQFLVRYLFDRKRMIFRFRSVETLSTKTLLPSDVRFPSR